tara:strand:+ start:2696 stop:3808 length:1113 start_codon:yes stop_codon:yes gene_type:complete
MAVIFTKNYSSTELLTTGNSWIVEFNSDNTDTATHCIVTVGSNAYTIEPNPSGDFTFDVRRLFLHSFSVNEFNDYMNNIDLSEGQSVFTVTDSYDLKNVNFTIYFEASASETASEQYIVKKGVYNTLDFQISDIDLDFSVDILLPSFNGEYYTKIVDGQPFDISLYSNSSVNDLFITNLTGGGSITPNMTTGVQRLFFTDGLGNNNGLTINDGWNRLSIARSSAGFLKYINVFQEPSDCKTVLKWFNLEGGWSYYPFSYTSEDVSAVTKGFVQNDYNTFDDYDSRLWSTGSSLSTSTEITAVRVPSSDIRSLKGLIASPKVYRLYKKSTDDSPVWSEIVFKSGDVRIQQTGKTGFDFQLKTFNIENGYTL